MNCWLKRLIGLLLALCLLTPVAVAEGQPVLDELDESVRALFVHGGALHAVTWDNMAYRQDEAGWVPLRYLGGETQSIDATDEAVWLLARQDETPGERAGYRIERATFAADGSLGETEPQCDVSWDVDADAWPQCLGLVVEGNAAYVLMEDPSDWEQRVLYRIDLESGKGTELLTERISGLRRYKDGLLLARHFNWEEYDLPDGTHYPPQIVSIDPSSGTMVTIGLMTGFADGGVAYDAANDEIYFRNSSRVYRANGDAPEAVGSLIPGEVDEYNTAVVMFDGRYYIEDYDGITSSGVDPSAQPERTLRVAHVMDIEDHVRAFARLHPEIIVEFVDNWPDDAEAITRHMQSSAAADLYYMSLTADYVNMRDKKYLFDLSSSDILMETVNRMDPHLTAEILVDGSLYAVPCSLYAQVLGWYPVAMEQMGLSVPTTYEELLECIAAWLENEGDEDIRLFEYSMDLYKDIFRIIYKARILSCQAARETPTFDTPAMRALLGRLETLVPALDAVEPIYDWNSGDKALLSRAMRALPSDYVLAGGSPNLMPLCFDGADAPVIEAEMSVLTVNPYSENADIAIELLEYIAQHMPVAMQTALIPEQNDPIEVQGYQENLAYLQESLADWEGQLAVASEEDRDILKERIQDLQTVIAYEEQHRWAYTAEELAFYREWIEPNMTYTLSPVFAGGREQTDNICSRYLDGQLSLDEFIREFDRVVWMMTMENQ